MAALGCVGNRPALQSNDILDRSRQGDKASVKHILIGWRGLESAYSEPMDQRARARSESEATELVSRLLERIQAGEPIEVLMIEFSEDRGSQTGSVYEVALGDSMDRKFRSLALRLHVGEVGVVLTQFGWHIMKRVK